MKSIQGGMIAALLIMAARLPAREPAPNAARANTHSKSAPGPGGTVDAFHAALHRGDARGASALLADEALIFESGGVEHTKAEYAAHHLPADAEFSRGVSSVVMQRTVRATGNLAWVASEGRTTGTYNGKSIAVRTTETMILHKSGSSWRIVHVHWSSGANHGG